MKRGKWEPNPAVRDELERFILNDQSRLGQVYRLTRQGLSAREIAETLGVSTSNFVWNNSRIVDALLDGKLSYASAFANSTATRFRSIARHPSLSGHAVAYLDACVEELERRVERPPMPPNAQDSSLSRDREVQPLNEPSAEADEAQRSSVLRHLEDLEGQLASARASLDALRQLLEEPLGDSREVESAASDPSDSRIQRSKQARWTRDSAELALKQAATMAYPLSAASYDQLRQERLVRGPSAAWFSSEYGGWIAACNSAGVEAGRSPGPGSGSRWTDEDALSELARFLSSYPKSSSTETYDAWARNQEESPSAGTIMSRFGSWSETKRLAIQRFSPKASSEVDGRDQV
jgi:hypothetical protein